MSDRPWLSQNEPRLRLERELLKELAAQEPAKGSVDRGWAALAAELPVPQAPSPLGGESGLTAQPAASWGLAAKLTVGLSAAVGAAWLGSQFTNDEARSPTAPSAHVAPVVAPPAHAARPSENEPPREAPPAVEPRSPSPAVSRAPASNTTLAEEGRLLASAHRLVQAGRGSEALQVLGNLKQRYPRSVLSQEREVLTIEAVAATGDLAAARALTQKFLTRHPQSPHASRLERFTR
jgi:hypothetical protein